MADKEVTEDERAEKSMRARVEFFASSLDAFLQEFMEKAKADDRLGSVIAAARVAQLASCLSEGFEDLASGLVDSPTEARIAVKAASVVLDMVNRNGEQCRSTLDSGKPAQEADKPNRSLS